MTTAAIIIPHYNDVVRLTRCLAALMPQLGGAMDRGAMDCGEVELVVVDNGSTQSLEGVRAAYPGLRIITEPLKGAANARNRGVAETTSTHLFFLDCDCVPAPDWLATARRVAGRADLVGGDITVFDETPPPRTGAQAFEAVFAFDNQSYIETKGFSVTANLLTRRDVFDAVGPFVPGLSEDIDWCRRAAIRGYKLIYAADLAVGHPSRGDWAALSRKWRRMTEEGIGISVDGPVARARLAGQALAMPFSILAHIPKVLRSARLNNPRDRLAALSVLVRIRLLRAVWMLRRAAGART